MKIMLLADVESKALWDYFDKSKLDGIDLIISAGDLHAHYLSFLATFVVWFLLFRTKLGLRIRAVGKDPNAAASMGIDVNRTKFIALIISGLLASFGGMYMSMGYMKYFSADMVAGRGFLGIAAQRLGVSNPILVLAVTVIFGAAKAFGITAQTLPSVNLPAQFASMTPYLATLIGLAIMGEINISHQKKRNAEIRRKALEAEGTRTE